MRVIYLSKIVYFKEQKKFATEDGELVDDMDEAYQYNIDVPDEEIISDFDDEYQPEVQVWRIQTEIQTI
jgi:hypothetical protein